MSPWGMTSQDHLAQAPAGAVVAVVRPGDTLVFSFLNAISDAEAEQLRAEFREQLPEGVKVCFIDQCTGITVVRPDGEQ